uniref:Kinesin motor domain-containing protein n=1 Tax=Sphaeramia orbicularis TaxID=375764 RepID=A0A673CUC8_9TELE
MKSEGQLLKEAMYINKSLSFLEQTVLAIADCHRDHIPFRQSKLTYTLKDSLGGNCNTVLVANIYGDAAHIDETLSTLRFASRMKCVQTEPTVNEHVDQADRPHITYAPLSEAQMADIHSQVHRYLDGSLKEIDVRASYFSSLSLISLHLFRCPPPKAEAFEDFKLKEGSEINHILKENKAILLERQSLMRQLTEEVNTVKRHIDGTMTTIQQHKDLSRGETVPQDPDATLMMQLRVLKAQYRQKYEALRDIKAEVNYCQHLVDQCRLRLLSGHVKFPHEITAAGIKSKANKLNGGHSNMLSFFFLEQVLHSPSAESFHSARYRVLKRVGVYLMYNKCTWI